MILRILRMVMSKYVVCAKWRNVENTFDEYETLEEAKYEMALLEANFAPTSLFIAKVIKDGDE